MRSKKKTPEAPPPQRLDIPGEAPGILTDEERFRKLEEAVNRRIDELLDDSGDITPAVVKDTLTMIQTMRSLRPEFLGQGRTVVSWEKD